MAQTNKQLVLVCGLSGSGKSCSFRNIRNKSKWLYLNTEAGKEIPFATKGEKFQEYRIDDPLQVIEAFQYARKNPDKVEGIIIDSLTFLMEMYESMYVLRASNTMQGWSAYQQFFKQLLQEEIPNLPIPVIFTAHVQDVLDEKTMEYKTMVPVKGALRGVGIEAYFSVIVGAKKVSIKDLEPYKNDMLHISEDELDLGFKHVFQTRTTRNTLGERIRAPLGLFSKDQTYIDNDVQVLLDYLNDFYA